MGLTQFACAPLPFDRLDHRGQCRVHRRRNADRAPCRGTPSVDDVDLADPARLVVEQRRRFGVGHLRAESAGMCDWVSDADRDAGRPGDGLCL